MEKVFNSYRTIDSGNIIKDSMNEITETYRFRYVIHNFVNSTLKMRYKRTVLGFFWTVLGPLLHYMIVGFVFSHTMRLSIPNYLVYMFFGAVFYNLISTCILRAPAIFLNNEHFIKKIYIPKLVFVLDVVVMEFVNFILALIVLLGMALLLGRYTPSVHIVAIVPLIVFILGFATGISCILGVTGVYFRDMAHIIPAIMQAFFFLTPVLYSADSMPALYQKLIHLNPFYYFVEAFRAPIVYNQWPVWEHFAACGGIGIFCLVLGIVILKGYDNKLVFRL